MRTLSIPSLVLSAAVVVSPLACAQGGAARAGHVVLDARFDDWVPESSPIGAVADGAYLYMHFTLPELINLQGASRTTTILLDVDGRADTGRKDGELGTDLEFIFSPPSPQKGKALRNGLSVRAFDDRGSHHEVGHAPCDFAFAPTYAAKEYEVRIARTTTLDEPVGSRFAAATTARGRVTVADAAGKETYRSPTFEVKLPPAARSTASNAGVPKKPDGAVRVISWNVEKEGPNRDPAPFARVFRALDPDVVLVQEWQGAPESFTAWFSANVPSTTEWRAHTFKDLGVAVIAKAPLVSAQDARLAKKDVIEGHQTPMRYVAALVDTPLGPLVACSIHLKCCGAMGTWEDDCRKIEARAINDDLRRVLVAHPDARVILCGDFNLVGTRDPLDQLRAGLDVDGSDLDVVETPVEDDGSIYTWTADKSEFSPGRLDFSVISDSALAPAQAFVLDTARLDDAELKAAGLERGDSAATDHRTLVVDLKARDAQPAKTAAAAKTPELTSITGERLLAQVSAAKRPVIVNLWATWCAPCVAELPDLVKVRGEFKDRGLDVVLVSCDTAQQRDAAVRLLAKLGVDFPTYIKEGADAEFIGSIDPDWNGTLPLTVGFDAAGKKSVVHAGQASYDEFRGFAERLLAPASGN